MDAQHTYKGACHCGGISVTLSLTKAVGDIELRACQCSFCTRHGAMTVSDAKGRALFDIAEDALATYQFASRSGTVLLCKVCGVYAGVRLDADGQTWSVANVRGLAIPEFKGRSPVPAVYEGETAEQRILRRKRMWTPTEVRRHHA